MTTSSRTYSGPMATKNKPKSPGIIARTLFRLVVIATVLLSPFLALAALVEAITAYARDYPKPFRRQCVDFMGFYRHLAKCFIKGEPAEWEIRMN